MSTGFVFGVLFGLAIGTAVGAFGLLFFITETAHKRGDRW
jgi:hypothetical protein